MVDRDIYYPNKTVEEILESLNVKLKKDNPSIKVYISTANPYNSWLQKLYNIYNNTELMEEQ
jgi:hypothetical protein